MSNYNTLKKEELIEKANEYEISTEGTRLELIERIQNHEKHIETARIREEQKEPIQKFIDSEREKEAVEPKAKPSFITPKNLGLSTDMNNRSSHIDEVMDMCRMRVAGAAQVSYNIEDQCIVMDGPYGRVSVNVNTDIGNIKAAVDRHVLKRAFIDNQSKLGGAF